MTFKSLVTAIADAIREKGGTTEKIRGRDIPDAIRNIKAGLPSEDYVLYQKFGGYNGRLTEVILHGDLKKIKNTMGYAGTGTGIYTALTYDTYNPSIMYFEGVKEIPERFYYSGSSYSQNVKIHFLDDEITEIGPYAFHRSGISELWPNGYTRNAIPPTITVIPEYCFYRATALQNLLLHDGITRIEKYAFYDDMGSNSRIANGELPASLEHIGEKAFYRQYMPFTKIPAGVKTIESQAFTGNSVIGSVTFLGTPTSIASDAFGGCANLTDIYVPWAEGQVANAPWGASATVHYNHKEG